MGHFAAFLFVLAMFLSLPDEDSVTTVILLPDDDGKVGSILVKTEDDERVLDEPYHSVVASADTTGLSKTIILSEEEVNAEYGTLLEAEPLKSLSFTLYFVANSSDLTDESMVFISQVVEQVEKRMPTEITIIGHTDTTGTDALNDTLSLERALLVEKIIRERIPDLEEVNIKSFGSRELLIQTPQNVDEPRNRRVEVLIL